MLLELFYRYSFLFLLTVGLGYCSDESNIEMVENSDFVEEDFGDGLKVLTTYMPPKCEFRAKRNDIIHYHYVGRLASDGTEFGKSFDYNTPYIVALGHGRIIPGMDRGLMGTCLWERRRISFPAHLGYGSRGIGKKIPPNSALIFYIRLIKIERNGHSLGEDADLPGIWSSGLMSYTDQDWEVAIDMIEEAIRLYNQYEMETLLCHKECKNVELKVSNKSKQVLDNFLQNDVINKALVNYSLKGKCLRECKSKSLPPQLCQPDATLLKKFKERNAYDYLHYAYYQSGQMELAARSCFTYLHYHPSDEKTLNNLLHYRYNLSLSADDFIYRDPSILEYQTPYKKGKIAYGNKNWLEVTDLFEHSLLNFKSNLEDCYLMCEDVVNVNLTQPDMSPKKKELLEEYGFKSDTMEYYDIQVLAIVELLKCRDQCYFQMSVIDGKHVPDFFSSHFNFIQYAQYKLGNIPKAIESAATFVEIEPSNEEMANNIRFYASEFKLTSEQFVSRKEYTDIHQEHVMDKQLLQFAEEGVMRKKGSMGDSGVLSKDEL